MVAAPEGIDEEFAGRFPDLPRRLPRRGPPSFPDPRRFDAEGLVAIGGDLSIERLLLAYDSGIFPWYVEGEPILWWSPDPRAVLQLSDLHVSRRLERRLRSGAFRCTWNQAFGAVVARCAERGDAETWILPEMAAAYAKLHERGHAHSLEVWEGEELAGGLYGVQRGAAFAGESMFHTRTDASKVALVVAVRSLFRAGIELFDAQVPNTHLLSMGAQLWSRRRFLDALERARGRAVDLSTLEPRP